MIDERVTNGVGETASASTAPAAMLAGLSAAGRAVPVALLVALPGLVFAAGFDHLAYGLGLLAGIVLAGLLVAPGMSRLGAASITEAVDRRFGRETAIFAGIVILFVVLPLLSAEFAIVGTVVETGAGVPAYAAIFVAFALSAATALWLGERGFRWLGAAAYLLVAASLIVPLVLMASKTGGPVVPHLAYGQALTGIGGFEEKLIENGLVDFDTFSPHVAPFLRLTPLDLIALVLSIALGTAVLPPLVGALAAGRRPAATRLAGAWTALFVMIVMISVPALAAYAKLEIYGAMAKATPLSELPAWLEAPLRAGAAHIHGTSTHLLTEVADAVRSGSQDEAAVAAALATKAKSAGEWAALDPQTQEAILASARTLVAEPHTAPLDVYLTTVLPTAAKAAGNEAAALTQASLVMEPAGLLLALPALSGAPPLVAGLISAGVLAAALLMAAALTRSVLAFGAIGKLQERTGIEPWHILILALGMSAAAAGVAALGPDDLVTVVVSALSLAAAGLFPALAIGMAWRRATATGAMAAILVGAAVTLYYDIGTQVFPASFYETWPTLSDAGETAVDEFKALQETWYEAEGEEAKFAAAIALDDWARGSATRPGLANWFGVKSAAGALFGVPLGVLALVLVSLATRPRQERPGRQP